jgi:ABC-type branched-subunit amino acid transport system ATPase component
MTVLQNMLVGTPYAHGAGFFSGVFQTSRMRKADAENTARAMALLQRVDLHSRGRDPAFALSHGQRRLLELARALATGADIFLLDEPTAGVFPDVKARIVQLIRDLAADGRTVLFIEHDMDVVRGLAHEVIVLDHGRMLTSGRSEAVLRDPRVIQAYLGRHG